MHPPFTIPTLQKDPKIANQVSSKGSKPILETVKYNLDIRNLCKSIFKPEKNELEEGKVLLQSTFGMSKIFNI